MPSELTGKAVYVVSSGIQKAESDGEVEVNPVKLFSDAEKTRVYARKLAKQLFWDRLKDGWSGGDGYGTPSDDGFSCDRHFEEENSDYIRFSHKPSYRLTDDDSDTGYVRVNVMRIDEAVKEETAEANDSSKKKKTGGQQCITQ